MEVFQRVTGGYGVLSMEVCDGGISDLWCDQYSQEEVHTVHFSLQLLPTAVYAEITLITRIMGGGGGDPPN